MRVVLKWDKAGRSGGRRSGLLGRGSLPRGMTRLRRHPRDLAFEVAARGY